MNARPARFVFAAAVTAVASMFGTMVNQSSAAVVFPSAWDFGTDPGKDNISDFTTAKGSATVGWSLDSDLLNYSSAGGNDSRNSGTATAEFTGLGAASSFTITATATGNTGSGGKWSSLDLLALGTSAATVQNHRDITFNGIRVRLGSKGNMSIYGTSPTALASTSWSGGQSGTYELTLTGTSVGADLQLDFTVTQGATTKTLSHTIVGNTFTGNWAGFGGYGDQSSFSYDSFSLVPEPASLALVSLGTLLMLPRRLAKLA